LKHYCPIGPCSVDFLTVYYDSTLGNLIQAGEHGKDSGLTAARVPNQPNKLALINIEAEVDYSPKGLSVWVRVGLSYLD
jgi:hypothetical protein